jgi:hypothetical protein
VGHISVDACPITLDSTPKDDLSISPVIVHSISSNRLSIPLEVETGNHTEQMTALVNSGAEGLFINSSIAHKWRKKKPTKPIRVKNIDGTYNTNGEISDKCLITIDINGKKMTKWFLVTLLGDQNLILGLPWLEKHDPIISWRNRTLEFCNSKEDKIKASIWSILHCPDEEAMPVWEEDIIIRYLLSHKGPEDKSLSWKPPFEELGRWTEDNHDTITINQYSPAQQMEHKYNTDQKEVVLPSEYLRWKEIFEKQASE